MTNEVRKERMNGYMSSAMEEAMDKISERNQSA
jgi:hypothetical protein